MHDFHLISADGTNGWMEPISEIMHENSLIKFLGERNANVMRNTSIIIRKPSQKFYGNITSITVDAVFEKSWKWTTFFFWFGQCVTHKIVERNEASVSKIHKPFFQWKFDIVQNKRMRMLQFTFRKLEEELQKKDYPN